MGWGSPHALLSGAGLRWWSLVSRPWSGWRSGRKGPGPDFQTSRSRNCATALSNCSQRLITLTIKNKNPTLAASLAWCRSPWIRSSVSALALQPPQQSALLHEAAPPPPSSPASSAPAGRAPAQIHVFPLKHHPEGFRSPRPFASTFSASDG